MRDFIITGMPCSGGALLCSLLNQMNNVVCFNEVIYNVAAIPGAFAVLRASLRMGEAVPNKISPDGSGASIRWERVNKPLDENLVIGLKANVPYLARLPEIMGYGCKLIVMVRNPIDTLADWNATRPGHFNEFDVRYSSRYAGFPFKGRDLHDCQAEVWNHWAAVIAENKSHLVIVRYEDLVGDTIKTLCRIAKECEINSPIAALDLRGIRERGRNQQFHAISLAVSRFAPAASVFGYK